MHRIREDFNNVDDHKDPGGGYSHIWHIRGYVPLNRVLFFKVLSLKQGMEFHY